MVTSKEDIQHAISKSQHCQRNWDLSQTIPQDDLQLMIHAVTQCPSKQNEKHYKVTVITNRNLIEQVHNCTKGFRHQTLPDTINNPKTNSQILANAVFAFTVIDKKPKHSEDSWTEGVTEETKKQRFLSIGIASGYLNVTATLLGYSTGCCCCISDMEKVEKIIGNKADLLMGVGFEDSNRNRREHHLESNFMYPTFTKKIDYQILD